MPSKWPNLDRWGVASSVDPGDLDSLETALALLYEQWRDAPNWTAFAGVMASVSDDYEALLLTISGAHSVADASGIHLDWIGQRFGRRRNGLSDDQYRGAIVARGAGLALDGNTEALITVLDVLGAATGSAIYEHWPAKIEAVLGGAPSLADLEIIAIALRDAVADGVGVVAITGASAPLDSVDGGIADAFVLDSVDADVAGADVLPVVVY